MTEETKQIGGFQNRKSPKDGLDDFPTPKWATRAFVEHCVQGAAKDLKDLTAWEPCANRGYMVQPLQEYFGTVFGSDIHDYGVGFPVVDFLQCPDPKEAFGASVDYIITNPPFNAAEDFVVHWYKNMHSVKNLCLLLRSNWTEGWGRYETLFSTEMRPYYICQYVGRVPIVAGRLDEKAATQMPYSWFIWDRDMVRYSPTRLNWIPAKKADYEREGDWPDDQ